MQLTTTHTIADLELELLGIIKGVASVSDNSFNQALSQLEQEAYKLKADAVIGVNCTIFPISANQFQTLVYGTAVKFKTSTNLQQF